MLFLIQVITIILAFISPQHEAETINVPNWSSLVLSVNKRTDHNVAKPLYSTQIYFNNSLYNEQDLVIDLDAPFIWHGGIPHVENCEACPYMITCDNYQCTDIRTTFSYKNYPCSEPNNTSLNPDYNDCEICTVNIINPVTGLCIKQDEIWPVSEDLFMMKKSNGRNVSMSTDLYSTYPTTVLVWPSMIESFPENVLGVLALSSSLYALPAYLYDPIERIVGLCLPTTVSAFGVLFFGNGPYYLSSQSNVDVRNLLSYTTLIKHPDSFGYFIGVNSILIKNRSIDLSANTTAKISTLDPYTILRTDIYNSVLRRFSKVTKRIAPAKLVAPFGLCFNMSTVRTNVPNIDLVLHDGKKWTITTSNSVKQVASDVACLAFIDGGATSEPAIVIGTHQFEDNFLSFNLENSTFGFSSSLLRKNTSCSNFNL